MTNEQRSAIENQIERLQSINEDLLDEISYNNYEIENLKTLLKDDSKVEDAVCIRHNNE